MLFLGISRNRYMDEIIGVAVLFWTFITLRTVAISNVQGQSDSPCAEYPQGLPEVVFGSRQMLMLFNYVIGLLSAFAMTRNLYCRLIVDAGTFVHLWYSQGVSTTLNLFIQKYQFIIFIIFILLTVLVCDINTLFSGYLLWFWCCQCVVLFLEINLSVADLRGWGTKRAIAPTPFWLYGYTLQIKLSF